MMSSSITNDFAYVIITLNSTAIKKSAVSCIMNKTERCYPDMGLKFNINEIDRTHYIGKLIFDKKVNRNVNLSFS